MNWNQEQYEQLTQHYRDLPDADLLHLATSPEDLTEIAEEILKKELALRSLAPATAPAPPREPITTERTQEEQQLWYDYAYKAPPHCTFSFPTIRQANDARAFLAESGVESQVLGNGNGEIDLRGPRVVVRPEDTDAASEILSQPIPEHIANEPEIEAGDFAPPTCPACNTLDPILIAVDPTNRWLCESCDHEWDDPA